MISYFIDHDVGRILYVELILIRNSNLLIFFHYLSSRNLAHGIVIKKKKKKENKQKISLKIISTFWKFLRIKRCATNFKFLRRFG